MVTKWTLSKGFYFIISMNCLGEIGLFFQKKKIEINKNADKISIQFDNKSVFMRVQQQIPLAGQEFRPREEAPINDNTREEGTVNPHGVGL